MSVQTCGLILLNGNSHTLHQTDQGQDEMVLVMKETVQHLKLGTKQSIPNSD